MDDNGEHDSTLLFSYWLNDQNCLLVMKFLQFCHHCVQLNGLKLVVFVILSHIYRYVYNQTVVIFLVSQQLLVTGFAFIYTAKFLFF